MKLGETPRPDLPPPPTGGTLTPILSAHGKYGNGEGAWVASFKSDVMTSADGVGSGPTPWAAVLRTTRTA